MIPPRQWIFENFKEFLQFLKSTNFSKSILIGVAVTVPIIVGLQLGHFEIGLAICFGAFWSSPSDVNGSYRHKKIGILFSAALAMLVSFIGGYLHIQTLLLLPVLGVLTFAISLISVYGFRASLISFSGLLALVLSFAHDAQELEIYQYALLVGVGGLWYLTLSMLWYRINPKAQTEEILTEILVLTAEYLEARGNLIGPKSDRKKQQSILYTLQSKLTENHETLREILIRTRKSSGNSIYEDKRLLVFVQLVEMLETAMANPVNYDKMDTLFKQHPEFVEYYQNLIFQISGQLREIADAGSNPGKLPGNSVLTESFKNLGAVITGFREHNRTEDYEGYLMLQNLFEYQEKQFEKLKRIKWLLGNPDTDALDFINREDSRRFIVPQDYDPRLLLRSFSFKSTIFKHSLRIAVTVMIGYALGSFFHFQNPYWILLTIIVIMRPSYGLTKSRSKDRIIGTIIGGAIASGTVFLVHSPYLFGALGIVSLVIAFSMVQKNYKASATFITLSVVFIYAILRPDIMTVIQYRILDTLIGAALSFAAMLWLWPAWGFLEIRQHIGKSVTANRTYLAEITGYYQKKGVVPTAYKVSRMEAFLETSNLSSAFQRMAQEPPSKQKNLDTIYELVVLNHTFLSSLASLSTYIQYNTTTDASDTFTGAMGMIDENLAQVIQVLGDGNANPGSIATTGKFDFEQHLPEFQPENQKTMEIDPQMERDSQEAHLVWEQLKWLFSISEKMRRLTAGTLLQ